MTSTLTLSPYVVCLIACSALTSLPEPSEYILSFPTNDNPLNITVNKTHPEMNYILTIGDWGAQSTTDKVVQQAVASKMITYYNKQKAAGYNLLFVAAVGDNFYYNGQDCKEYKTKWTDIYGDLVNYPWLAVMGNHDWGNSDKNAVCAWSGNTKYVDPITNIPYAVNQINTDKKGCNLKMYYLPDFGYYYTINDLNFELIALEESVTDCPEGIGGGGTGCKEVWQICGNSTVGCEYLGKMRDASEQMMVNRSIVSSASNFLLIQHFPTVATSLIDTFKQKRTNNNSNEKVWCAYGHTHVQRCDRNASNGVCDAILTGGGGGCCSENTLRGFYVIGFDKNKSMIQPLAIDDPQITCEYPCSSDIDKLDEKEILKSEYEECCYTEKHDGFTQDCDLYKCAEFIADELIMTE